MHWGQIQDFFVGAGGGVHNISHLFSFFSYIIIIYFFKFSLRNGFGRPLVDPLQPELKSQLSPVQLGATVPETRIRAAKSVSANF